MTNRADVLDPEELTPRGVLRGMLDVWDYDPERWTQGALSRSRAGHDLQNARHSASASWCAAGAGIRGSRWSDELCPRFSDFAVVQRQALELWAQELHEILSERLGYRPGTDAGFPVFLTDHPETTFDDVLLATKRALDTTYEGNRS